MLKISSEKPPIQSNPATIKPVTPSFTRPRKAKRSYRQLGVGFVILVAVTVVLGTLLFLPEFKFESSRATDSLNRRVSTSEEKESKDTNLAHQSTTPFRDMVLERAKTSAQQTLVRFSELQNTVESRQLGLSLDRSEYDRIIDQANAADVLFSAREFDDALQGYESAADELERYIEFVENAHSDLMTQGNNALAERDATTSRNAFTSALELIPNNAAALAGLTNVDRLPNVKRLIREAERAALRHEYNTAKELYLEAQETDPSASDFTARIAELGRRERDDQFNVLLSQAYEALNKEDVSTARSLFESALVQRPENAAAKTGLQQIEQTQLSRQIVDLKMRAESLESQGLLKEALDAYKEILAIDSNIQFARDGTLSINSLIETLRAMNRIIEDPDMLSSNTEYQTAQQLLGQVEENLGKNAAYDTKFETLSVLIEDASVELPLTLLSDNSMDIRLSTIGDLGPFFKKELQLRPGRYLVVGSADGCTDIRMTIVVARNMNPIEILCNEPI